MIETTRMENKKDDLQNQIKENNARIEVENDAIAEIKQSSLNDLAETESLKEKARILHEELDRCEELEMKRGETIKDLHSEVTYKRGLISNLQRDNKSLCMMMNKDEVLVTENSLDDEVKKEAENFYEVQQEIKDGALIIKHKLEDDLKLTKDTVSEMEKKNLELTENVLNKEKEIENMRSRLKDVQALKIKQNKQLEELQSCFDKLGEQTAIERNKNRALSTPDIELIANDTKETKSNKSDGRIDLSTLQDDMKESNVTHERALSFIRQHHDDVLSDFDKQMQAAVKRKKPEQ
jgi:hypothetical protein